MDEASPLDWFPKRFAEGDIDGAGARRLLGVPNISTTEVLVRETAQNSWDARRPGAVVDFNVTLRRLGEAAVGTLRDVVFAEGSDSTDIDKLLTGHSIRVLEISDRGTVGLDGPVRADLAFGEGESRNFANLILNLGAPRDVHLGGGTYGFGKTIAYVVSKVSTVIFWTRCHTAHGVEDRLIASAIGDAFDLDGYRYTGRHWWGILVDDRVEPIRGQRAAALAERLFANKFATGATGTSMLIVDPQLDSENDVEIVADLKAAMTMNLWPKMVPESGRDTMNISLIHEGTEVPLQEVTNAEIRPLVDCLVAVRAAQAGGPVPQAFFPTRVFEIASQRPPKVLGHLALSRWPRGDKDAPSHHVALMRTDTELVVKYEEHRALPDEDFGWVGVFKPTAQTDDSFASAEPPAHDDWVVSGIQDARMKRDVNIALREIRNRVNEFVAPLDQADRAVGDAPSAASLGNKLASLLVGLPGNAPERTPGPRRGSSGVRRPSARVDLIDAGPSSEPGWTSMRFGIRLERGSPLGEWVAVVPSVGYDGGSGTKDIDQWIRPVGWMPSHSLEPMLVKSGRAVEYLVECRDDVALDIDVKIVNPE